MAGKFIVKKSNTGFKFDLKASNGEVILTSEVYTALPSCKNGIASIKTNASIATIEDQTVTGFSLEKNPKFEMYADKASEYRFRLKARNGEIIGTSEGYKSKASCQNGIESVKKNAVDAVVVEE